MTRGRGLLLPLLLAAVAVTTASCGGGSSSSSSGEACTRVQQATKLAGKKGVEPATYLAKLDDALSAAADVKDPKVRKAAQEAQSLMKTAPSSTIAAGTFDFSRIGAVAKVLDRCERYLR
ncbi:MAG TPA: hypothetical protein VFW97_09500 [Acidimicrobiia bacterium]|jgi:hypothetical protein|nr:hypothetical protein [Acidimicrobiia bacterium]